jgi:lactoylglutathione lyase
MQLGYTILYVPNVPATLKFYEAAFGLTTRFLHESGDYGELETGSTALAFSSHSLMQQLGKNPQAANAKAPCFEIALCTPMS